jgi:Tol biopolymer transport system component
MPNVDQPRRLVVTILVSLLVGCTPSENIRSAERMPETHEQVPSGLIAFVSDREGSDGLFVMHPDGSGIRRLTRELPAVSHPSWSADGQRIAFNAGSPTASDISLIDIDGSGLTKITSDAGANFYPTWSPDGSRLAFSSNRDGDWDIYVMKVDGSDVRQLVDSSGLDDKPRWSPDGSRIGFATARSGSPELMAVDPETGEEQTLLSHVVSGLIRRGLWMGPSLRSTL